MDYAKYAYLKAVELETQKSDDNKKMSNVIEFAFLSLNKSFSTNRTNYHKYIKKTKRISKIKTKIFQQIIH